MQGSNYCSILFGRQIVLRQKGSGVLIVLSLLLPSQTTGQELGDRLHPFTARVLSIIQSDGKSYQLRSRYAQRSDGSTAYFAENDPPPAPDQARGEFGYVTNVLRGQHIATHSLLRAAVVTPLEREDLRKVEPRYSCKWLANGFWKQTSITFVRGFKTIEVIEEEERKPLYTRLIKLWVAPDLDCFQMKRLHTKNGIIREMDEVESIRIGEPDSAMFDVPQGYSQVSPAEFEALYRKRFPGTQFYGDEMLKRKEAWHQQALAKAKNGKSR